MNIDEQPSSIDQETSLPPVPVRPPTPENCAVCLNNKQADVIARIDSCVHTFCFPCVLEWSKVRAICPLCKQPFTVITRERYSGELIEEIRVAPTQAQAPNHFSDLNDVLNWVDRNHTRRADTADGQERNSIFRQMVYIEWLNTVQSIARRPEHARSNPLGNPARSARLAARTRPEWTTPSANQISLNSIRRLIDRYMRQSSSDRRESTVYSQSTRQTVAFRKHIYLNRLYVQSPLVGHNGNMMSVRECSPTWYAANRACLHRLIPFLGRELLALLWNDAATIERVIHEILTTIQLHDIRSRRLARKLNEYLGQYTKHFVHEFYAFARCPYDLAGFDRHAQYPTPNSTASAEAPVQISLDDDQDGNAHEPIVLDETVDSSSSASSSPAMIELDERSTSPECEIVEYVEPSGERTPTLIVLSEDEDADVMHDPPSQTARSTKRKQRRSPQRSKKQQTTTGAHSLFGCCCLSPFDSLVSSLHSATNVAVDGHDATEEQTFDASGDR